MRRYAWDYADDARGRWGRYGAGDPDGRGPGGFRSEAIRGGVFRGGGYRGGEIPPDDAFRGGRYREDVHRGRSQADELRGRGIRGEELRRGAPYSEVGRDRSAAWLAEPVGGRVGYDRLYGSQRGARYGERYDLGYAPLSEMNPIARALRREYRDLARRSRRRSCRPGNDGW